MLGNLRDFPIGLTKFKNISMERKGFVILFTFLMKTLWFGGFKSWKVRGTRLI